MDQRSIVARIAELVSGTAPGSAGSTAEVIFGVLHGALNGSRKAREISSTLKARYGVGLSVKEVAEYIRFRGSKAGNSPGGADGAAGGARKTRARIITALLAKVDRMVEEIIHNPSSETTQLVKCLLLTEMTTEDGRIDDLEALFKEEHRREQLAKELEIKKAELKQKERSLAIAMKRVQCVQNITDKAQKAGEGHKPFNYDRALKQISAVIGVGRPLVEYDAPQKGT